MAGLLQKSLTVPSMLDGHLRQQQATASAPGNEQAVAANVDVLDRDWARRREDAQLNFQKRQIMFRDRRKPVIVERGCPRSFRHGPVDRATRKHIAYASAQLFMQVEGCEGAAKFGQVRAGRLKRNRAMF